MQFIFNNTMSTDIRSQGVFLHGLSRNNITTKARNGGGGADEIADYDIVTAQSLKPSKDYEPNGYFEQPKYVNAADGDYHLVKNSLGIDDGQNLDNFSKYSVGRTDIGAFEDDGKIEFFPYRPIDISANKYYVEIKDGEEAIVEIDTGIVDENLDYKIHANLQNDFLTLEGIDCELEGKVCSSTKYTVKIKADLSNHYYWLNNNKMYLNEGNGMLYFRFSNGLSLPITICVKK